MSGSFIYRRCVRPLLFAQDSEKIHNRMLRALAWTSRHPSWSGIAATCYRPADLPVQMFGLNFPNPIGLAAGMDKHAAAVPIWDALGFGYCELGGVTWHAQPGNSAPRMFRVVQDEALINRMGFNNAGAEAMSRKLAEWRTLGRWPRHPVGINLGKSKITPLEEAAGDYANSFRVLREHADFFVVNVSSPNTPNLRQLQDKAALDEILAALQELQPIKTPETPATAAVPLNHQASGGAQRGGRKPILIKVAPDLSFDALDEILELVGPREVAGIVATNTTITRPPGHDPRLQQTYSETGGLSGRPLRARSTEVVRQLYRQTRGALPIIGVGGIFNSADAWEKITAGASLIQIYTGLVYEGPGIAKGIVEGLKARLAASGNPTWRAVVGSAVA